jgi:hypothetical protein
MTTDKEQQVEGQEIPSPWFDEWSDPLTLDEAERMCQDSPTMASRIHTAGWDGTHGMTLQEYHMRQHVNCESSVPPGQQLFKRQA